MPPVCTAERYRPVASPSAPTPPKAPRKTQCPKSQKTDSPDARARHSFATILSSSPYRFHVPATSLGERRRRRICRVTYSSAWHPGTNDPYDPPVSVAPYVIERPGLRRPCNSTECIARHASIFTPRDSAKKTQRARICCVLAHTIPPTLVRLDAYSRLRATPTRSGADNPVRVNQRPRQTCSSAMTSTAPRQSITTLPGPASK